MNTEEFETFSDYYHWTERHTEDITFLSLITYNGKLILTYKWRTDKDG